MTTSSRPGLVFISYKREEAPTAAILREALVKEGYAVWWDEDLQCGQAWAETLDEAVRRAACIIVLWSAKAVASQWVRHEASQAIARDVYAPCRIELVQLESPYDRIQATDLIGWEGDQVHGGFRNLLARVETLVPAPVSLSHRIGRWVSTNFATLVSSGIAVFAMWLLVTIFVGQRGDRLEKLFDCSASREIRRELALERYSKGNKDLRYVCLSDTNLIGVTLMGADLSKATLTGARLYVANLSKAILNGAKLSGADLSKATLAGASLAGANLSEANISKANLARANFRGANLSGADLGQDFILESILYGRSFTEVDFTGACADVPPTDWPENFGKLPPCPKKEKKDGD